MYSSVAGLCAQQFERYLPQYGFHSIAALGQMLLED